MYLVVINRSTAKIVSSHAAASSLTSLDCFDDQARELGFELVHSLAYFGDSRFDVKPLGINGLTFFVQPFHVDKSISGVCRAILFSNLVVYRGEPFLRPSFPVGAQSTRLGGLGSRHGQVACPGGSSLCRINPPSTQTP